jgi:DNA-binding protein HU-beta
VNKAELIDSIAGHLGDKRTASEAVEAVIDTITRTVARGEKVAITGFGIFEKVDRAARMARNPATGAKVKVKKTSVPKFRPGTQLKAVVSGATKLAPAKAAPAKAAPARGRAAGAAKKTAKKAAPAKKAAAKKAPAKKAAAKKAAPARAVKKATTKKAAPARAAKKAASARKSPAKAAKAPARKSATKRAAKRA